METMECDHESCKVFVQLARKGPRGYMECTRILHHLLKDKDLQEPPGQSWNKSRWLKSACYDALRAIEDPQEWEQGPTYSAKGASKSSSSSWDPWQHGASSAFGPADPHQGKGKGKAGPSDPSSSSSRHQGFRG